MSKTKTEADLNLKDKYFECKNKLTSLEKTLSRIMAKNWDIHMECYMLNNNKCVEHYENLRLSHLPILFHKKAHDRICLDANNKYFKIDRNKIDSSLEEKNISYDYLYAIQREIECMESRIHFTEREIKHMQEGMDQLKQYLEPNAP
jgi:hypothetical protein